jgi:RNA-directed DNA polymerase
MQRKLSQWATQDKSKQCYGLYDLLYDKDWLRLAHDHVAQNAGSITAGCDGITMQAFDEHLEKNLHLLAHELRAETFTPAPVRRVYIPKASGKLRPLGIASIRDRIVQEAVRMVLEPIYEADFSPYSFGFRPTRSVRDAVKCILWNTQEHKKFFGCIEGDIASYFDTVNQEHLVRLIRRRIKDEWLITLLWKFLRAGVMEGKLFKETREGVPQGGIVSPLMSNVYLTEFDRYMERYTVLSAKEKTGRRRHGEANSVYCRYADDFVALGNGTREQAEQLKEEMFTFLRKELKLELSWEKTKITHLNDGFDFVGFRIVRAQGQTGMTTKVLIPPDAIQRLQDKIRRATAPSSYQDSVTTTFVALNRLIGGWCRYYQYTSKASSTFAKVEYFTFWKVVHWLGRKYKLTVPAVVRRFKRGNTFATADCRLVRATDFRSQTYRQRFLKPNPYTTQVRLNREEHLHESTWTGYEARPGMTDLRPLVWQRDEQRCRKCESPVTLHTAQIDHVRPVRRFRRAGEANRLDNLQTLCKACHTAKTQSDHQRESPARRKLHTGFGGRSEETTSVSNVDTHQQN